MGPSSTKKEAQERSIRWLLDHPRAALLLGVPTYFLGKYLTMPTPVVPEAAPPDFYSADRNMQRREFPMPIQFKTAEEFTKTAQAGKSLISELMREGLTGVGDFIKERPKTAIGLALGLGGAGLLTGPLGDLTSDVGKTLSYRLNRAVHPWWLRVKAPDVLAEAATKALGGGGTESLLGLAADIAQKGTGMASDVLGSGQRQNMLKGLFADDPTLANQEPETLMRHYDTMAKFAPTLAQDESAVRSFLREAVMSQAGPDYSTISGLARAEKNVQDVLQG